MGLERPSVGFQLWQDDLKLCDISISGLVLSMLDTARSKLKIVLQLYTIITLILNFERSRVPSNGAGSTIRHLLSCHLPEC